MKDTKKVKKIFLSSLLVASPIFLSLVSSACGSPKDQVNPSPEAKKSSKFDVSVEVDKIKGKTKEGWNRILPSSVSTDDVELKVNGKDASKVDAKVYAVIKDQDDPATGKQSSNKTGKFTIRVKITDKNDSTNFEEIDIPMSGFSNNPYGADENGKIDHDPTERLKSDLAKYIEMTQSERFNIDNEKYITSLEGYLKSKGVDVAKLRKEITTTKSKKEAFDKIAKEIGIDTYDNSLKKGFTLPNYDEQGNFKGLALQEGSETPKTLSWVDAINRNPFAINGLARLLPNEMYRKIAHQTYLVSTNNPSPKNPADWEKTIAEQGTMWIMDYIKKNDGKYPTKWYFGTNIHVSDTFRKDTLRFSLGKLDRNLGTKTIFKTTLAETNSFYKQYNFNLRENENDKNEDKGVKTVYEAKDFLKRDPADYLIESQKTKYKDAKEFVDFSVLELDFEKLYARAGGKTGTGFDSAEDFARELTNNYADDSNTDKIKFKKVSYLKDYSKIDRQLGIKQGQADTYTGDSLYAAGWPNSRSDHFLKQYEDDDQIKLRNYSSSFWVNSESVFYEAIKSGRIDSNLEKRLNSGNYLSYAIGARTFTDKPGVVDAFISSYHNGDSLFKTHDGKEWIAMGLNYMPKHYSPGGGSSGSSIRTQANELVAIFHTGIQSASTGLAAAFRSEGFDYKGAFGNEYKLPQYDLIYGGGMDQNVGVSYREAMKKLYANEKSALFPQGFDKIAEGFEFNNNGK